MVDVFRLGVVFGFLNVACFPGGIFQVSPFALGKRNGSMCSSEAPGLVFGCPHACCFYSVVGFRRV